MKRIVSFVLSVMSLAACDAPLPRFAEAPGNRLYLPQEGDILFQSLPHSPLVTAIEGVSGSPLSHCGVVTKSEDGWTVLEAIGPVQETGLDKWIARGRSSHFAAFRLLPPYDAAIARFLSSARAYLGRPYDALYEFDDEKIYCSELVYKAFWAATGKPLGQAKPLGALNWKPHEEFIKQTTGGELPLARIIITPVALSEAPELQKIHEANAQRDSQ
jgi:Permuted papain-like amidase enzyme, YaeF/YiiX, C92 family